MRGQLQFGRVMRDLGATFWVTLASLFLALILLVLGPPAVDQAAHFHLQSIFDRHGFDLWDNTWYLGRYSFVNYSFLFYLLGYVLGIKSVALLSVGLVVASLSLLTDRYLPKALAGKNRAALMVVPVMVLNGAWPFLLGAGFMFIALLMRSNGRKYLYFVFSILVLLSSPLALLALIVITIGAEVPFYLLTGWSRSAEVIRSSIRNPYLVCSVLLGVVQLISIRAFPDHGYYPYWWTDLVLAESFSALCYFLIKGTSVGAAKAKAVIALYGVTNLVSFVVRSNLGSNAARIEDLAFPIVVTLLSYRRLKVGFLRFTVLVLALIYNLMPIFLIATPSVYKISTPSFWNHLKPEIAKYYLPGSRIELVDTVNHQGDYYLPHMGYPIVRGWFRQDDFPQNQLLYDSKLSPSGYISWLQRSGASLVLLPPGPYDFSSQAEASLLVSGQSGLRLLAQIGGSRIYQVPGRPTIVRSPDGRFIASTVGISTISFDAKQVGTYHLSVNYSPYLDPNSGSICRESSGLIGWKIYRTGPVRLEFDAALSTVAESIIGSAARSCGN